jgi:hypothetical protein
MPKAGVVSSPDDNPGQARHLARLFPDCAERETNEVHFIRATTLFSLRLLAALRRAGGVCAPAQWQGHCKPVEHDELSSLRNCCQEPLTELY